MTEPPDLATLLRKHIQERFDNKGSQALARLVNHRFAEQPDVDFLTRNTIDNWMRGHAKTVREWEKLAAVAAVLGLSEPEADELLRSGGQLPIAEKRLCVERAIHQKIVACWPPIADDLSGTTSSDFIPNHTNGFVAVRPPSKDDADPIVEPVPSQNQHEQEETTVTVYNTRWLLLLSGLLMLLVLVALAGWQSLNTQPTPPHIPPEATALPFFADDFTFPGRWDLSEATYSEFNQKRLWFDTPVNQTGDWRSDVVNPQWTVDMPISRLRFTVELEMPLDQTWGFLGVQTECYSERYADDDRDNDWLLVYIGGVERTVWLEYTTNEKQMPVQEFHLDPITTDQPYTIDLIWTEVGVQVYLNDKPQGRVIPCLRPRQFNLNAGLDPGMRVRGYIDDFQVWE